MGNSTKSETEYLGNATRLFSCAEEAWFWFIRCQRLRREGARIAPANAGVQRPCDPDDLYRAVVSLAREGRINRQQMNVLERFGLLGRPPDARCADESVAARNWEHALAHLAVPLRRKGIIE
ncbi:MAG: hypothetical protein H6905_06730 [Hyphomicrobiales bacterium]|nr:hypothetical protein [Hyphomicrobiales bacterium]